MDGVFDVSSLPDRISDHDISQRLSSEDACDLCACTDSHLDFWCPAVGRRTSHSRGFGRDARSTLAGIRAPFECIVYSVISTVRRRVTQCRRFSEAPGSHTAGYDDVRSKGLQEEDAAQRL